MRPKILLLSCLVALAGLFGGCGVEEATTTAQGNVLGQNGVLTFSSLDEDDDPPPDDPPPDDPPPDDPPPDDPPPDDPPPWDPWDTGDPGSCQVSYCFVYPDNSFCEFDCSGDAMCCSSERASCCSGL